MPTIVNVATVRIAVGSVCGLLIVTGCAKILAGVTGSEALHRVDPISGLDFGLLIVIAGIIEISATVGCLMSKSEVHRAAIIACTCWGIGAYRLGWTILDMPAYCNCLGNLTGLLRLSASEANILSAVMLVIMIVLSTGALLGALYIGRSPIRAHHA